MSKLKAPPVFNADEDSYEDFKRELEIWDSFTELEKKKRGPAVYLSLQKKTKQALRGLKPAELSADDGLLKIIDKLDEVYLADSSTRAYTAFQRFYNCKREEGETFEAFIIRFEDKYSDMSQYEMTLPDSIKAFFLLNAANLPEETERLARATADLSYRSMKDKIKRICGTSFSTKEEAEAPPVKEEALYGQYEKRRGRGSGRGYRGNFRGRGRGSYDGTRRKEDEESGWRKCFCCNSREHLIKDCPERKTKFADEPKVKFSDNVEEINIVLMSATPDSRQKSLIIESLNCGVLDCGCTRTVCGEFWMKEYLANLEPSDRKAVKEERSKATFRFGDGKECSSMKRLIIPAKVGRKKCLLGVEVVKAEIPLLISKPTMKNLKMELNCENDTAIVDEKKIKLSCTSSGHYIIPLNDYQIDHCNITLTVMDIEKLSLKEKKAKALKLHRQFGHATEDKLVKLVKSSKMNEPEFVKCIVEVCNNCEICSKYRTPHLKPVVSLPLSQSFNQVVCLDLKEVKPKCWILHMIDSMVKYSAARIIKSKHKDVVIKKIFEMWISYFGTPGKLMSDNGGEFLNEVYTEASEKLGVEITMPPAESPFSNGIVERHNKVLAETLAKTMDDAKCDIEVALAWAVSAKNSLLNNHGYSPNQLVFGHNVSLPNVLTDDLPALSGTTSSDIVRKNLQAIHSARKSYVEAENSEKIRRALRHKTRKYSDHKYSQGEKVYFRRRGVKGWKGPATVLGFDGYTVLVKQGGSIYRCHRCNVMKVNPEPASDKGKKKKKPIKKTKGTAVPEKCTSKQLISESDSDSDSGASCKETGDEGLSEEDLSTDSEERNDDLAQRQHSTNFDSEEDEGQESFIDEDTMTMFDNEEVTGVEDSDGEELDDESVCDDLDVDCSVEETSEGSGICEVGGDIDDSLMRGEVFDNSVRPKPNLHVAVKMDDKQHWIKGRVLKHQPKRTGQYKDWVNVHLEGELSESLNWENVEKWIVLDESEHVALLSRAQEFSEPVVEAKQKELNSLIKNDVFDEVDYKGQYTISTRWVFSEKEKEGKPTIKARLVARGFEEDSDDIRTDSPTCSKSCLRLVMVTAACYGWKLNSMDVASAFLQGNAIERDVFVRPPRDVCAPDKVWKLKRCLYGLNDAPRAWYNKVTEELIKLGAVRSKVDNAMFMWFDEGRLIGHLVSHVDDFIFAGVDRWREEVIGEIRRKFNISSEEQGSFRFLGLNIRQYERTVYVDQRHYIDQLKEIPIDNARKKQTQEELSKEERSSLKSLSGQMIWVTSQSRPDMAFESCVMSVVGKNPTIENILNANKAVRKIKSNNDVQLRFPDLGSFSKIEIIVYSDATHASLPDGASQGAYVVFCKGKGKVAPILWQSKKLKRVTKSPLASETLALGEAADAGILIANLLSEIHGLKNLPPVQCITDSKSLRDTLHTSNTIEDMSLRVNVGRLREMINLKEISVRWVEGKMQLADPLTKRGASADLLLKVLSQCQL